MKARIENNKIRIYSRLPSKYVTDTMNVAGGFDLLPAWIHEQEGFFDVVTPAFDAKFQKLGDIYFDQENRVFTYTLVDLEYDLDVLLQRRLEEFEEFQKGFRREITELYLEEIALGILPEEVRQLIMVLRQRRDEIIAQLHTFRAEENLERLLNFSFYTEETQQFRQMLRALKNNTGNVL